MSKLTVTGVHQKKKILAGNTESSKTRVDQILKSVSTNIDGKTVNTLTASPYAYHWLSRIWE